MAHFAILNEEKVVTQVVVVANEKLVGLDGKESEANGIAHLDKVYSLLPAELLPANHSFVQTSYNGSFRKNFAGAGFTWREDLDGFVPPKPDSNPPKDGYTIDTPANEIEFKVGEWVLNEQTCNWDFVEAV